MGPNSIPYTTHLSPDDQCGRHYGSVLIPPRRPSGAAGNETAGPTRRLAGCAQAVALIPGVSRSGATITAGLLGKLDRETATRFSFLLSGPIIFGAGLVALRHLNGISIPLVADCHFDYRTP